ERAGEGRLHDVGSAPPDGFGGHDHTRENTEIDQALGLRDGADLFEPAADEGYTMHAEDDDAVGESGKDSAEQKSQGEHKQAFEVDERSAGKGAVRTNAADEVADRNDSTENQRNIARNHGGETQPFAKKDLPAMNGLGGDGLDCGGLDFAGDGIDAGEDGHENCEHVHGVKADLQDVAENLAAEEGRDFGEVRIGDLKVHAGAEQGEKGGCGEQCGPKNFAASRFTEGDASDDPELHHSPWSSPMIFRNDSSRESRSGVNSKMSTLEVTR